MARMDGCEWMNGWMDVAGWMWLDGCVWMDVGGWMWRDEWLTGLRLEGRMRWATSGYACLCEASNAVCNDVVLGVDGKG